MSNITAEDLHHHCEEIGCTHFVSDLDGSILETQVAFDKGIINARLVISNLTGRSETEVDQHIRQMSRRAMQVPEVAVRPDRWKKFVLPELELQYGLQNGLLVEAVVTHFEAIYTTKVALIDGAAEVFPLIKQALPLSIVSHSDNAWMWWKINHTEIATWRTPAFATDPSLPHKDWPSALISLKIHDPSRAIAFGDNPLSDIIASREAGIPRQIWLDRFKQSEKSKVEVPEGTLIIHSLHQLPQAILSLS